MDYSENIRKIFVSEVVGKKAKEQGFNEECLAYYLNESYPFNLKSYSLTYRDTSQSLDQIKKQNEDIKNGVIQPFRLPTHCQLIEWFAEKGVIVRLACDGIGYEVRAKEWEEESVICLEDLNSAELKAFTLL